MGTYKGKGYQRVLDQAALENAQLLFKHKRAKARTEGIAEPAVLPAVLSCRFGLSPGQRHFFGRTMAVLGVAGLLLPNLFLFVLSFLFLALFAAFVSWRFVILLCGLWVSERQENALPQLDENELPIYSVMVAVYDEAPMMRQLAKALSQLNWPAEKLDIILLLEVDDEGTLQAALKAGFPAGSRLITVPDGQPRTKPRALNYGLELARGEFVCIYDAEDRPHPDQLRQSYEVFKHNDARLACVQAPLIGTGASASWIAAHWCLEYAVHFQLVLPGLSALKAPIPLGGTSNHFRVTRLRDAGGWDAWNVTEDADLGLRFARLGWDIKMIRQGTYETAPTTFGIWCRQRSRWIKGFIQTWLVLMSYPATVIRQVGLPKFVYMQLTLGSAILAPIVYGPFAIFVCACLVISDLSVGYTGWSLMTAGYFITLIGDIGAPSVPLHARLRAALTRPLYWPLHSIPAVLALYELVVRPHYWAKTPHEASEEDPTECSTGLSVSD